MNRRHALRAFILGGAAFALASCEQQTAFSRPSSGATVFDVARANNLGRFLAATEAAGLTGMLRGDDQVTVFAPSDRAFAAFPRAGALLQPSNREELSRIVRYHIVPGRLPTGFLEGMDMNHATALGPSLNVNGVNGLRVNGASVIASDLSADNGTIHVIDRVLTPR